MELGGIKKKYEDAVRLVSESTASLGTLFKTKMIKVKAKISKFFADVTIKMNSNLGDVRSIGQIVQ